MNEKRVKLIRKDIALSLFDSPGTINEILERFNQYNSAGVKRLVQDCIDNGWVFRRNEIYKAYKNLKELKSFINYL